VLEEIRVDGFKSLNSFFLEIRPGLNILVGPNGSGKSNIVLFFEFLSRLADNSAMQATSLVGGAGAIFSLLPDGKLKPDLTFSIKGTAYFKSRYKPGRQPQRSFTYEYSATIQLTSELASLTFRRQSLRLLENKQQELPLKESAARPAVEIIWTLSEDGKPTTCVPAADEDLFVPLYYRLGGEKKFNVAEFISDSFADELRDYCIFSALRRFIEPLEIIHEDLVQGRALNIDPNRVRQAEDIASEPGIRHDGGGLAATLFYSQRNAERPDRIKFPRHYSPRYDPAFPENLVSQVEQYVRLINDQFVKLEVDSNPFENKIRIALIQEAGDLEGRREIRIPISLASDGTAKWLALTTAILSSTSAFAIEEPENFLHPHMQQEIVNLVRKVSSRRRKRMFALMTTHSETLLNAVDPEEVIVVSMRDGRTRAVRPANADELRAEIASTGFGLGFFYFSGALE
jgi:predicted ATPase